jgi:protease-4
VDLSKVLPTLTGRWEIDLQFGVAQLANYLFELEHLDNGGSLADNDYSTNRQNQMPVFFHEQEVYTFSQFRNGEVPEGSVGRIVLDGAMRMRSGLSTRGVDVIAQDFREMQADPNIVGVVVEVSSGGGEPIAGALLQSLFEASEKPVVALVHYGLSAAYKAVLTADEIVLSTKQSEVGSIGTVVTINKEVVRYLTEQMEYIYASTSPRKNEMLRNYMAGNRDVIEEMVTERNEIFLQDVLQYRGLTDDEETRQGALSGAVFVGEDAINRGLADSIGTLEYAVSNVINLAARDSGGRSFYFNQNQGKMNLQNFRNNVIAFLNSKLGAGLNEDASAEEVVEVLNNDETFDQFREGIIAEIQQAESGDDLEQRIADLEQRVSAENIEALESKIEALSSQVVELRADTEALNARVQEISGEEASRRVKNDENKRKQESGGNGLKNPNEYRTVRSFYDQLSVEGESKF